MKRIPAKSEWDDTAVSANVAHERPLRIKQLQCDGDAQQVSAYAAYLSRLLGAPLTQLRLDETGKAQVAQACRAAAGVDLVVLGEPKRSLPQRLLALCSSTPFVQQMETSILVARAPRRPLHRLLVVLRVDGADATAVGWTAWLAAASGAAVTALAVVPPVPALYAAQVGIDALLAPNTTSGARLRRSLRQLADGGVDVRLRMRQGDPDWQMRQEVAEGGHDLVVIAAEKNGRWQRWLLGELVTPLLRWSPRPVLVTRSRGDRGDERFSRN